MRVGRIAESDASFSKDHFRRHRRERDPFPKLSRIVDINIRQMCRARNGILRLEFESTGITKCLKLNRKPNFSNLNRNDGTFDSHPTVVIPDRSHHFHLSRIEFIFKIMTIHFLNYELVLAVFALVI